MKFVSGIFIALMAVVLSANVSAQNNNEEPVLSWEVLQNHEIPEWFKDAKFGIYAHLGVYCVPAFEGEWYPRLMLQEGHIVQKNHIETYGPIDEFVYHDFITMFKLKTGSPKKGPTYTNVQALNSRGLLPNTTMAFQCGQVR